MNKSNLRMRIEQIEACIKEIDDEQKKIDVNEELLHDATKVGSSFLASVAVAPSSEQWEVQYNIYNKYEIWYWMRFNLPALKKVLDELIKIESGEYISKT